MMNMQLLNRSGLAAIAAATALIATPALGQETVPTTPDPAPIVADEPLTVEPLSTPAPAPEATSDTLAPAAATSTRSTRANAAPAARAPAPAARNTAPAAAAPVVAAPAPTTEAIAPADPAMVAPLPEPVTAAPVAPTGDSMIEDNMLPIAGAAGLGILALAGAGLAMRRRRRDSETELVDETWHDPAMSPPAPVMSAKPIAVAVPVMASAPAATPAFDWSNGPRQAASTGMAKPLNRIEAAKRGPTPDNPSLSLKKRLKRAAFFDQRDRQIATGRGTPISANAGLPDALTPVASPAPAASSETMRRSNPGPSMSFGKTFQPA